jgi:hypothetical protein
MPLPVGARIRRRTVYGALGGLAVGVLLANCCSALWLGGLVTLGLAVLACVALGVFVAAGGLTRIWLRITRAANWTARHRRLSLRIGAAVLIAAGIAVHWWETRLTVDTPLRIQATANPQTAVFLVGERFPGSVGCGVWDVRMRGMIVEGRQVVLAEEDVPRISKAGLFSSRSDHLMGHLVRARIHMEPRTLLNSSLPPQCDRHVPCYVVVLDWVSDVAPVTEQDWRKLIAAAGQ